MTPLATAYDNIRLIRRKVRIAQDEVARLSQGAHRDEAVVRVSKLSEDLVRAVQDFAELGYEEELAELLAGVTNVDRRQVYGLN